MIEITGKENHGIIWHDVWRVTCDLCGKAIEGIDARLDATELGWTHAGALDECLACRNRAMRNAE